MSAKTFKDHFIVRVQASVQNIATLNERSRGIRFAGELMKYLFNGTGMLTYAASLLSASRKGFAGIGDPRRTGAVLFRKFRTRSETRPGRRPA